MDPQLARQIEDASLRAWPSPEVAVLDGWELRCAGGFTKRANSVQPFGPSTYSLFEKVGECEDWYEARGLPVVFRLTPFAEPGLDAYLEERGYALIEPTDVLSMPLGPSNDLAPAELRGMELDDWVRTYVAWSGRPTSDAPLLVAILRTCRQQRILAAVSATERSAHVACGLAVLDHDLVGLFDLITDERYRRRGHGAALVAGLLAWGLARGAQRAYLQVVRTNTAARELYRKLGFSDAYSYWYRVRGS